MLLVQYNVCITLHVVLGQGETGFDLRKILISEWQLLPTGIPDLEVLHGSPLCEVLSLHISHLDNLPN